MNRIERLIGKMSLAEKLGQLTMTAADYAVTGPFAAGDSTEAIKAGTIGNLLNIFGADRVRELQRLAVEESRLGIPLLIGLDVVHGHRTLFPIPLGEAATFDPRLWSLTAREAAVEAAADGLAMTFAPMLDVSRDARWGRGAEGPGEDPWLAARIAEAKVRGFQGADLAAPDALAAVAKHYCAYGAVTAGRDYASVDISERTLHEVHMPPFAAAVAAGVAAVMPAFTDLAGIPMTANGALLTGWLRRRLNFDGVIVSDFNAVGELIRHGIAADLAQAAALALNAGVDIDMMADAYRRGLPIALERRWVTMADIEASVRRVLSLKVRLGLFEDPYRRGKTPESAPVIAARRRLARAAGARAIVMLKNDGAVLPLPDSVRRLAVIGPLADASAEMRGPWWAAAGSEEPVSVLAGLRGMLGESRVLHQPGVEIDAESVSGIASALELCAHSDAILLCVGESAAMSGEAASRAHLGLPGRQRPLAEAVLERARVLRKPVIVILFSGRALVVPWLIEQADAVLAAWFPGSEAGNAIGDLIMGRIGPSGRTPVSWPRAIGQVPLFYGQRPSGRPADPKDRFTSKYLDASDAPLFPFGHGLTYGECTLSNLRVTPESVTEHDTVEIRVDVANGGARGAEETVFLFARDKLASVARPLLELKGFGRIHLDPGQSGTVTMFLAAQELKFLGLDLQPVFEPGEVEILVGPCADRSRLLAGTIQLAPPPRA
ncbi:MAG TPA: glycoside hydrolase family 3 N-terminal domain-containing protein [Steroidobacteraceae bacterium]|nr:glycoside hydrolase family 3 N-terminal domain-containing protein [Steroidobacteraceae bacterium]